VANDVDKPDWTARQGSDPPGSEWPAKLADTVADVIGGVRNATVRPAFLVARVLVFGIVAGSMLIVAVALVMIGLERLFDDYVFVGRVWATDALFGALLTSGALLAWRARKVRS